MLKYTKHYLKKIEDLFVDLEYTIRYEKGNFKSGYCIVEDRKIAVINRFFEVEARINVLIEILGTLNVDISILKEKNAGLFKELSSMPLNKSDKNAETSKKEAEVVETESELEKETAPTKAEVNI